MKNIFIRIFALCLCLCMLLLVSCKDSAETQQTDTQAQSTENTTDLEPESPNGDAEGDFTMKDIKICGKTLDQFKIVTDTATNDAGAKLRSTLKKELDAKFIIQVGEQDIALYPDMPYIRIVTLPVNGLADTIKTNETRFYEDNGNFKIVLGSRQLSELAAVDYFVNDILAKNKDLTGYNEVAMLTGNKNLMSAASKAETDAKIIIGASNQYTAADKTASGKCYYVSYSGGDDSNDGLSPEKPWKTIDKVSNTYLATGSVVLFKRGDEWRFDSYANASHAGFLILQSGVIYSSYGVGAKPVLNGSPVDAAKSGTWTEVVGYPNVWKYSRQYNGMPTDSQNDVGNIIFNGGEAYGYKQLLNHKEMPFAGLSDLDAEYEFWYNTDDDSIYLYCEGNPSSVYNSIEMGVRINMVRASGVSNIVFDNFTIKYGGAHGIALALASDISITNCELAWLGGGVYSYPASTASNPARYGNGVEINRDCMNITVDKNYIYQMYDTAITNQFDSRSNPNSTTTCYQINLNYTNNVIQYCHWGIEYFIKPSENYPELSRYMKDITFSQNSIMYTGYGWGYYRPASGQPGSSHIKGWHNPDSAIVDGTITVENNAFIISRYDMICATTDSAADVSLYRNNVLIQYEGHRGVTIGTDNPAAENRPVWNESALAENIYLKGKGNSYYTVK